MGSENYVNYTLTEKGRNMAVARYAVLFTTVTLFPLREVNRFLTIIYKIVSIFSFLSLYKRNTTAIIGGAHSQSSYLWRGRLDLSPPQGKMQKFSHMLNILRKIRLPETPSAIVTIGKRLRFSNRPYDSYHWYEW